jgi:hypothetical protein
MPVVSSPSILGNAVKAAKGRGQEPETDPAVLDARRSLAEEELQAYVREVVASAPPLTPEQQSRLRSLFQASSCARAGDGR